MTQISLKEKIKNSPQLKRLVLNLIMHPVKTRPRWTTRLFQFLYLKRGKKSVIYRSVRKDLVPFNNFSLGQYSVIEDYCTLNNAVGDVTIGDYTRIGMSNTIIGPVQIGDKVNLAQNIVVSGLNHNFTDVNTPISDQGVPTKPVIIGNNVWIGANVVILPGVTIGEHVVIGAGSIVARNIPSYTVVVGNPAQVVKEYDFEKKQWVKKLQ